MILVTLGTHPQPMDRLVRRLEELLASGELHDEVVVQAAAFGEPPQRVKPVGLIGYDSLVALMREADVVISHAGPATLAAARSLGKVPVVVPRMRAFREHVDDHQVRYAERLKGLEGYVVVDSLDDLPAAIAEARGRAAAPTPADVSRAVALLDEMLEATVR